MASGSSKPSVLCKLAQGVLQHFNNGLSRLEGIPYYSNIVGVAAKGIGEKHSSITQYWHFYKNVWAALAHRFAAQVEWEKCAYGKAIAYQQKAVDFSNIDKSQSFLGELSNINSEVAQWRAKEASTLARYKAENSTIYYDPVPSIDRLDVLPSGVVIMKLVPFFEPEVVPFSLSPPELPPPYTTAAPAAVDAAVVGATGGKLTQEQSIITASQRRLEDMGFEASAVRQALTNNNQNEQAAIEQLLCST